MRTTNRLLFSICLFSFISSACKQQVNLTELIVDIDGQTGSTPAYDPDRVIPLHLSTKKDFEPLMVDPDIMNLAIYKPVSASDEPVVGELEQLTDDIKTSGDFDYVGGPAWIQVDLQEPASIHAIVVWHYYTNQDIFDDVIVCISEEVDFTRNVVTLYNNDHDNSSGLGAGKDSAYISSIWGNIIDARDPRNEGTTARFVRVYTSKNFDGTSPRYLELAVYGFMLPSM
jgi:hypothetical protein